MYKLRTINICILILFCFFASCMKKVPPPAIDSLTEDYIQRKEILANFNSDFFTKLEKEDSASQKSNYLKFLLTYMPISDFADYEYSFFEAQVDYALMAKKTFPWARDIPEDIFMQYVLPPRVNNENLDTARMVFYRELKERLIPMNLSMEQAVLEINHWCHEKINYRGTDERTISPLAAMKSGFGRCGEESTFAVTALRSAGIPARQVYTPRWAHTDDNHAWVEVWINGKWYFLGACEPAPVLNTGWFAVPATRTMLVHTKQFGRISASQRNSLSSTMNFTWINALSTYAPVKKLFVAVYGLDSLPLRGAEVKFQIYNYAELYSIYTAKTNIAGLVEFETGYGSIELNVSYQDKFVSSLISPQQSGLIKVYIGSQNLLPAGESTYIPPVAGKVEAVDKELELKNAERLSNEDRIRAEYEFGFYNEVRAKDFIKAFNYQDETKEFLINSCGNWPEIESFLIECSYNGSRNEAVALLSTLSEKDLRDTKADILSEHLVYALKYKNPNLSDSVFNEFVLCPRVDFEMLKPYRKLILGDLDSSNIAAFRNNPEKVKDFIQAQISTVVNAEGGKYTGDELNSYNVPITPYGVHKLKFCDEKSLMIYYVAFYRTLGIPAKIDKTSNTVSFYHNQKWNDLLLTEKADKSEIKRSKLYLYSTEENRDLKYRIHFSIAQLTKTGFETVDLGWEIPLSDFANGIDLPLGDYMLLTAIRNEDGSVNVRRKYFKISENTVLRLKIILPDRVKINTKAKSFNHNVIYDKYMNVVSSASLVKYSGYTAFCWIKPGEEPSKHIVKDLVAIKDELTKNKIDVVFLTSTLNFDPVSYGFSANLIFYYDKDFLLLNTNSLCKAQESESGFPHILLVNSSKSAVFTSDGYTISIGEMLINSVAK